jgi:hypothetical protein
MTIVETRDVSDTKDAALRFSTVLAGDLGVPNEIIETHWGHVVLADDGKAVSFHRKWRA